MKNNYLLTILLIVILLIAGLFPIVFWRVIPASYLNAGFSMKGVFIFSSFFLFLCTLLFIAFKIFKMLQDEKIHQHRIKEMILSSYLNKTDKPLIDNNINAFIENLDNILKSPNNKSSQSNIQIPKTE